MEKLTKREMAEILINCAAWDGSKDVDFLCKNYSLKEIKDAYDMIDEATDDYYNN